MKNNLIEMESCISKIEVQYSIMQSWNPLTFICMAPLDSYEVVHTGTVADDDHDDILEYLFNVFNQDVLPQGYKGRSLSVGDIVVLDGTSYMCEMIGWSKL